MNIEELIKKYNDNRDYYISTKYNEAQLRIDFLDPFFELLGWDIKNTQGKSTNEREVLLEEPLKENATSNTKKPDYTFRLFSERKFFLEAKKPSVKINISNGSARQVRRYGFTAKLKISVLSDFEYLAIYDCSQEVKEDESVEYSRIKLYHYSEYKQSFDEIKNLLSQESVYSGAFDETWNHIEEQLKYSSIDTLFLAQINEWRTILGKEIYSHNSTINEVELNDIVQSCLNSIIFLRVCEDRNLETYETLLNFANTNDYQALINKFKLADKQYNAGLFNHPLIDEIISNNYSSFWIIIKHLYFPQSSYSFSVFSSDILGRIYEIFLGEQLIINNNKVVLSKKPEHIDRDIVTTPTFIIQDILKKTVVPYCQSKSDKEILSSTFADIACGSGAFLVELYQLLDDILVDYYLEHDKDMLMQTSVNTYKLPYKLKKEILKNCIFGVDKDYNAVEACKFGLLIKLLEGEDNSTISTPALPDLEENICFGNSLIDSVKEHEELINPYSFEDKKFDVIVGNPPYMSTEDMKKFTPLELPLYKEKFISAYKQFDKYFLFIERCVELLNESGYLGYIIPSKFMKVGAGKNLRKFLSDNQYIEEIVSFGANQVFQGKTTYTALLTCRKDEQKSIKYYEVQNLKDWKIKNFEVNDFDVIPFSSLDNNGWVLISGDLKATFNVIIEQSISLENLIGSKNINNGIQTSANSIYIHIATREDDKYLYFTKDGQNWKIEKKLTRPYFKTMSGIDSLNTYRPFVPNSFVIYPYIKIEESIEFIEINVLKSIYPYTFKYLMHYKTKLDNPRRDIKPIPKTSDEWYRYGRHQSLDKCDVSAKIIVGVLSQGDKYAIDYHQTLISSGGTAGYCMITLPTGFEYSIYYIQALLNSKYLEWFSSLIGEVFRGGYIARGTKVLKKLPIRVIDFSNEDDKSLHDTISEVQQRLIGIQTDIDKNINNNRALIPLKRQFQIEKTKLDNLLTSLYNLEDDNLIPLISEIYAVN
jgi:SAM-dependent methyltransferase